MYIEHKKNEKKEKKKSDSENIVALDVEGANTGMNNLCSDCY